MAINVITATQVENDLGYSRWRWVPLLRSDVLDTARSIPYAEMPDELLPASLSQYAAETTTCTIIAPWGGFNDPWTDFIRTANSAPGSVIGALSGINQVEQAFAQKSSANYGLGREYVGPELGYCVGTLFKEKVYSEITAQNILNIDFLGSSTEDLIFRSKFEQFYLNHGIIRSFTVLDAAKKTYTVTIDTKAETTSVGTINFSSVNDTITLYSRNDGSSMAFSINEVRGVTGSIEIDVEFQGTADPNFQASDFFVLSRSWWIQDPYLLDGVMNRISTGALPTGSQTIFRTDQNSQLSEGSATGVYIRRRNIAVGDSVVSSGKTGTVTAVNGSSPSSSNTTASSAASTSNATDQSGNDEDVPNQDSPENPDAPEEETQPPQFFVVEVVDIEFNNGEVGRNISVDEVFVVDDRQQEDQPDEVQVIDPIRVISETIDSPNRRSDFEQDPISDDPFDFDQINDEYFSPNNPDAVFDPPANTTPVDDPIGTTPTIPVDDPIGTTPNDPIDRIEEDLQ